jgi:hypothetical protein
MLYAEEVEVPDLGADAPKKPPFWQSGGFQWQGFVRPEAAPWGDFRRAYASPRESTCPSCVGTPVGLSGTEACQVMPLAASSRTGRWAEMTAKFGCPVRLYPFWFWPKSPVTGAFGYGWFKYIPFIHGEKDMRARDAWSKAHPSDYMTPPYMEDFGSDSKPAAPAKPADPAIQASTAPTATVNVIPPPPVTSNLAKKAEEELLIQSTIDASKKKKEQQLVAALAIGAVALIWWTRKNKKRK